jgi:hypothetical protein
VTDAHPLDWLAEAPRQGTGTAQERTMHLAEFLKGNGAALERFRATGGRWLVWLVVDEGRRTARRLWFVVLEDGRGVLCELDPMTRTGSLPLRAEDREVLEVLGWHPPEEGTRPFAHLIATTASDFAALELIVAATVREVLGLSLAQRCTVGFQEALLDADAHRAD